MWEKSASSDQDLPGPGWGWGAQVGRDPILALAQVLKGRPSHSLCQSSPGSLFKCTFLGQAGLESRGGAGGVQGRGGGNLDFKHDPHMIFMFLSSLRITGSVVRSQCQAEALGSNPALAIPRPGAPGASCFMLWASGASAVNHMI